MNGHPWLGQVEKGIPGSGAKTRIKCYTSSIYRHHFSFISPAFYKEVLPILEFEIPVVVAAAIFFLVRGNGIMGIEFEPEAELEEFMAVDPEVGGGAEGGFQNAAVAFQD